MKFLKFLFFLVLVALIGGGYYIYRQKQVGIPNSMVQTAVSSQFPIERTYPFGKIKLFNPKIFFQNDKLIIETEYLNEALGDKIEGTMTFETDIRYDVMDSKLYLDDFKIIKLTKGEKEINLEEKPIIRTALNYAFSKLEKKEILSLSNLEKFQAIKDILQKNKIVGEK